MAVSASVGRLLSDSRFEIKNSKIKNNIGISSALIYMLDTSSDSCIIENCELDSNTVMTIEEIKDLDIPDLVKEFIEEEE